MVLVTGGTGLIGSHLLFDLVKSGMVVRAIKRKNSNTGLVKKVFCYYSPAQADELFNAIQWTEGDVLDAGSLLSVMEGVNDVYHCAAVVSFHPEDAKELLKINIEGSANVVNACLQMNVRKLCYVSSTAALGKVHGTALVDEKTKWNKAHANSVYSISKHHSEREVWRGIEEGLNTVIVNPCIVVGPGEWGRSSTGLFPLAWKGLSFYTGGINAFVDVRDVSKAMTVLMKSDISGERFLIVSENLPYRAFFNLLAEEFNKPYPYFKAEPWMTDIAWRAEAFCCLLTGKRARITNEMSASSHETNLYSNEKIKKMIGMEFIPVEQSVRETAAIFLNEMKQK